MSPFHFLSDLSDTKLRPAIVLADAGRGDWILCQITSNSYADPHAVESSSHMNAYRPKVGGVQTVFLLSRADTVRLGATIPNDQAAAKGKPTAFTMGRDTSISSTCAERQNYR